MQIGWTKHLPLYLLSLAYDYEQEDHHLFVFTALDGAIQISDRVFSQEKESHLSFSD